MALKLHRQFVHPTHDKLISLINNAGTHWSENELKEEIKKESQKTAQHVKYTKKHHLDQL